MVMILRNIIAAAVLSMASIPAVCADGVLGIDGEESTSVGIYIKDLESGEVVLDHNSQLALTPASVMKCITAATALSVNGASGRFVTPVALRGAKGDVPIRRSKARISSRASVSATQLSWP